MSVPTFSQWLLNQNRQQDGTTPAWASTDFSSLSNPMSLPGQPRFFSSFDPTSLTSPFHVIPTGADIAALNAAKAQQSGSSSNNAPAGPYGNTPSNTTPTSAGNGSVNTAALSALESQGVTNTLQYMPDIEAASKKYGVPDWVIASTIYTESRGNFQTPDAGAGAVGLGQFVPSTSASLHVDMSTPAGQIDGIAKYTKMLHDQAVSAGYSGDQAWLWAKMYYGGFRTLDAYDPNTHLHGYDQIKIDSANQQAFEKALSGYSASGSGSSTSGVPHNIQNIINQAGTQVGKTPYVWGGETPNQGFDCSGLVQYYYNQNGYNLPRTAQQQYNATQHIDFSQAKAGDLLFFAGTDPSDPDYIDHVAIYLGNGKMLSASNPNAGIQIVAVNNGYWNQFLAGVGKMS